MTVQKGQTADVADLLLLQQKLRDCSGMAELGYFLVNNTSKIFAYSTAILWLNQGRHGKIAAISGLPFPVANTPFDKWFREFAASVASTHSDDVVAIKSDSLPAAIGSNWQEFLPADAVWLPFKAKGRVQGGLILARDHAWTEEELGLLPYWSGAVAHAIGALLKSERVFFRDIRISRRVLSVGALGLMSLLLWLPVSMSILAPAEIVAKNAVTVRSPINGVIGSVLVQPNQAVDAGETLILLDDTGLKARIDVSRQELAIAQAEFRRADQAAVTDRRAAAQFPMLKARIVQHEAELEYDISLLERAEIRADAAGVIIISRVDELEGMPVEIGQKILTLADPSQIELEMWIAVGDSIPLSENAEVRAFLNVRPQQSYGARVEYVNYQAEVSPDGIFAFRSRAVLDEEFAELRIGWRGTAKLYGEKVPLYYYLFRRPLSGLRQWLGL